MRSRTGVKAQPNAANPRPDATGNLYSSFANPLLTLYRKRRSLESRAFREAAAVCGPRLAKPDEGAAVMKIEIDAVGLWLIPLGLALWFLFWVLWNLWREERRSRASSVGHGLLHSSPAPPPAIFEAPAPPAAHRRPSLPPAPLSRERYRSSLRPYLRGER